MTTELTFENFHLWRGEDRVSARFCRALVRAQILPEKRNSEKSARKLFQIVSFVGSWLLRISTTLYPPQSASGWVGNACGHVNMGNCVLSGVRKAYGNVNMGHWLPREWEMHVDMWKWDIVYWESVHTHSNKTTDVYSQLTKDSQQQDKCCRGYWESGRRMWKCEHGMWTCEYGTLCTERTS